MKRIIFSALILGLSISAQAKVCKVPMDEIELGSIRLMKGFDEFKLSHRNAQHDKSDIWILGHEIDSNFAREGVISIGNIDYDSNKDQIIGFALNYTHGKYADFETLLDKFKSTIVRIGKIPKTGWVLRKDDGENKNEVYEYVCDDYKISIGQDYGAGRTATGATVLVLSRYSYYFSN
jgi:hypothetical protein